MIVAVHASELILALVSVAVEHRLTVDQLAHWAIPGLPGLMTVSVH